MVIQFVLFFNQNLENDLIQTELDNTLKSELTVNVLICKEGMPCCPLMHDITHHTVMNSCHQ